MFIQRHRTFCPAVVWWRWSACSRTTTRRLPDPLIRLHPTIFFCYYFFHTLNTLRIAFSLARSVFTSVRITVDRTNVLFVTSSCYYIGTVFRFLIKERKRETTLLLWSSADRQRFDISLLPLSAHTVVTAAPSNSPGRQAELHETSQYHSRYEHTHVNPEPQRIRWVACKYFALARFCTKGRNINARQPILVISFLIHHCFFFFFVCLSHMFVRPTRT